MCKLEAPWADFWHESSLRSVTFTAATDWRRGIFLTIFAEEFMSLKISQTNCLLQKATLVESPD